MTLPLDTIIEGDALAVLRTLPGESVDCCVTSPPYFGLRDYGVEGQLGLESTVGEYIGKMVEIFEEVRRVLKPSGTLFLNMGDSYASGKGTCYNPGGGKSSLGKERKEAGAHPLDRGNKSTLAAQGYKPKDLLMIPARLALALQDAGWWLRSDIIWCLSGGTWVYARTQKGDMPMMIRDLARLKPGTVKLWNGQHWTDLLGISKSKRQGDEIQFTLRSGERIACTPTHKFPTQRGLLEASQITIGDEFERCELPEPETIKDCADGAIDADAAWFAGLYIAEGSRSGDTIQISGHAKETARAERLQRIARKFGGSMTCSIDGNKQSIRLYGKMLAALLDELTGGRTSKDKCFAPVVWRYSNGFIAAMIDGYLSGDGHWDEKNGRWRLGFTRNYNLERDLRTGCARLRYELTLKMSEVEYKGRKVPTFRGEIRKQASEHHNARKRNDVIAIDRARCREVYDLGVADDPHLFALASGILTHNSKPNPMPESVTDRPTSAHEHIFLLAKAARYYYDADAIAEPSIYPDDNRKARQNPADYAAMNGSSGQLRAVINPAGARTYETRNARNVWTITTKPFKQAHFATFPPELPRRCILAGSPKDGIVLDPFMGAGTTGLVAISLARHYVGIELNPDYIAMANRRIDKIKDQGIQQDIFAEVQP